MFGACLLTPPKCPTEGLPSFRDLWLSPRTGQETSASIPHNIHPHCQRPSPVSRRPDLKQLYTFGWRCQCPASKKSNKVGRETLPPPEPRSGGAKAAQAQRRPGQASSAFSKSPNRGALTSGMDLDTPKGSPIPALGRTPRAHPGCAIATAFGPRRGHRTEGYPCGVQMIPSPC